MNEPNLRSGTRVASDWRDCSRHLRPAWLLGLFHYSYIVLGTLTATHSSSAGPCDDGCVTGEADLYEPLMHDPLRSVSGLAAKRLHAGSPG